MQDAVFPDLCVLIGFTVPLWVLWEESAVCEDATGSERSGYKSCIDIIRDLAAANSVSGVSPVAHNLARLDMDEVVHGLAAWCCEWGRCVHDLLSVDQSQLTISQIAIAKVVRGLDAKKVG